MAHYRRPLAAAAALNTAICMHSAENAIRAARTHKRARRKSASGQTGKHLLVLSFAGFDPERSSARRDVAHRSDLLPCRDVLLVRRAQAQVRSWTCLICRMTVSSNGGAWSRTSRTGPERFSNGRPDQRGSLIDSARQADVKCRARAGHRRGPYPSVMSFDNRATDR